MLHQLTKTACQAETLVFHHLDFWIETQHVCSTCACAHKGKAHSCVCACAPRVLKLFLRLIMRLLTEHVDDSLRFFCWDTSSRPRTQLQKGTSGDFPLHRCRAPRFPRPWCTHHPRIARLQRTAATFPAASVVCLLRNCRMSFDPVSSGVCGLYFSSCRESPSHSIYVCVKPLRDSLLLVALALALALALLNVKVCLRHPFILR